MDNKIIKTALVEWEKLKPFQPIELKKMSKNQLNKLKTSFKANGFKTPFYVWEDKDTRWVLDGHQRLPILKLLRDEGDSIPDKLPAIFIDCKNKKEAKKAVLIFNSHYADIQQDILADWIKDLDFEDLKLEIDIPDIDFNKIEQLLQPETNSDDEVPEDAKPITKLGDLWELGRHRVLCGDSTKIEDVERLMDGKKADMSFTDPPYNVDYEGGLTTDGRGGLKSNQRRKLINDNLDIYPLVVPILANIVNGANYTWFAGTKAMTLYESAEKFGDIHSLIIWVKNGGYGALNANYKQKHEPCLYWKAKNKKLNFCGDTTETTIWEIKKDGLNKFHPTQKPVELAEKAIKNHSVGLILDLFLGSGSTLIACEKTNRICYGMELDEHYCDVIRDRYINWCKDNDREYSVRLNGKSYNPEKPGIK